MLVIDDDNLNDRIPRHSLEKAGGTLNLPIRMSQPAVAIWQVFDKPSAGSVSSRNNSPSARRRNDVEHKGFAQLASIALLLKSLGPLQAAPARPCCG